MAPAQFFAGWYNGLSKYYDLQPSNILECYQPSEDITNTLYDGMEAYLRGDEKTGKEKMDKLFPLYKTAVANCDQVEINYWIKSE